jgi:hypothetical protein
MNLLSNCSNVLSLISVRIVKSVKSTASKELFARFVVISSVNNSVTNAFLFKYKENTIRILNIYLYYVKVVASAI